MVIAATMTAAEARAQVDKFCESYMKLIPNSEKHAAKVDKSQFPAQEKFIIKKLQESEIGRSKFKYVDTA